MIGSRSVLAVVPARGGSKGLPKKNIRQLCGKPLISWTIEQALGSRYIDSVVVSTDCEQIASISKAHGARVPFLRPKELATDFSRTYDAVEHCITFLQFNNSESYDYIALLEPTSPLREAEDIDNMLEMLVSKHQHFDSIVSIGEVDEHPSIMLRILNNRLVPYCESLERTSRRQDNEPAFFPYGLAYIVKTATLLDEQQFFTKRCTYYKIKRYQNYEIDDIYGFLAVENIMKFEWGVG